MLGRSKYFTRAGYIRAGGCLLVAFTEGLLAGQTPLQNQALGSLETADRISQLNRALATAAFSGPGLHS